MQERSRVRQVQRVAKRRGFKVSKCRIRDPKGLGYGRYIITNPITVLAGDGFTFTLDQVEQWLEQNR